MTTLQDIMGLIAKRKVKVPTDKDYIIAAAYTDAQEVLKPQPKMEANLLNIGDLKKYILGNSYSDITKSLIRNTYASMIADGTPTVDTLYTVLNDENKSYVRATYFWKSNGQREWIASTPDN